VAVRRAAPSPGKPEHLRWPDLVTVTDLDSAQRAIDTILERGEGARGDWRNAHFGQFVEILDECQQMRAANPSFDPVLRRTFSLPTIVEITVRGSALSKISNGRRSSRR